MQHAYSTLDLSGEARGTHRGWTVSSICSYKIANDRCPAVVKVRPPGGTERLLVSFEGEAGKEQAAIAAGFQLATARIDQWLDVLEHVSANAGAVPSGCGLMFDDIDPLGAMGLLESYAGGFRLTDEGRRVLAAGRGQQCQL